MFICETCLDEFEGPAIETTRAMGFLAFRSRGPCEVCSDVGLCVDIWSGADFHRKTDHSPVPSVIDCFRDEYDFLSNFHVETADGLTTEHLFQAAKAVNKAEAMDILAAPTPGQVKRRGRYCTLRPGWDEQRDEIMLTLVRMKFKAPELRDKLLATGDAELIEGNTWGDQYWGVCQGVGENKLGKILMQVREELRNG